MDIAIVEDELSYSAALGQYIERYANENNETLSYKVFSNGLEFVNSYRSEFDIIFFDIKMPLLNGIDAAKIIRKSDEDVVIIFITTLGNLAIKGYEVNALDFVVKPVSYPLFSEKLERAIASVKKKKGKEIIISNEDGVIRLNVSEIMYVEKDKNYLVYHTKDKTYKERGTMQNIEEFFTQYNFAKCISGCLVNLRYVNQTTPNSVIINNKELPISRQQYKSFISAMMQYLQGN